MSAGRYVFFFFFFLFGCSAMMLLSGIFTEGSTVSVSTQPTEIRQRMEGAHSRGATLFQYKRDVEGIALCNEKQWLFNLDANIKEIELTSQERINLTLCKYDPETAGYYIMQEINWTNPGDYLVWESSGLCGLRYE